MTIQATVLLALAALVTLLLRRLSASFRHYVWVSCLLALPFLAVPSLLMPTRPVALAPTARSLPSPAAPMALSAPTAAKDTAPAPLTAPNPGTASARPGIPSPTSLLPAFFPDWRLALCVLWMAGVLISLGRLAAGLVGTRALMRASMPIEDGPLADTAALLHLDTARIVLRQASPETAPVPMTWGAVRPVILFPADADTWPYERLRAALLHETAHVRRGDWLTQTLIQIVCAALWFHPFVWLAARACRAESERACDDVVLTLGMAAPDYARHLLDMALAANGRRLTGVVAMAQTARIETRLKDILAVKRDRRPLTRRLWLGAFAVSVLMIGTAGVLAQATGLSGMVPALADRGPLTTLYTFSVPTGKVVDKAGGLVNNDGAAPVALVQGKDGNFYGTTQLGGINDAGTLFEMTPSGTLTVLHTFSTLTDPPYNRNGDGNNASRLVIGPDGNYYGTTARGGSNGGGTFFKMTPNGALTTLYNFPPLVSPTSDGSSVSAPFGDGSGSMTGYVNPSKDGVIPSALVLATDGNFYGTTAVGGTHSGGTVFRVTPSGTLTTLHSFSPMSADRNDDGDAPSGGLVIGPDSDFYGATNSGGPNGAGTIFRITPSGTLTTLYAFSALSKGTLETNKDGAYVDGLVFGAGGLLYGTTTFGGMSGKGTVFAMTSKAMLTTLHTFSALSGKNVNRDGATPGALVIGPDGNVYGTASEGGSKGGGTLFRVTPNGTLTTLINFDNQTDGSSPNALIVGADGNLYGTASGGEQNAGTIFRFTCPNVGKAFSNTPQASVAALPKTASVRTTATAPRNPSMNTSSATKTSTHLSMTFKPMHGSTTTIESTGLRHGPDGTWTFTDATLTRLDGSRLHAKSMTLKLKDLMTRALKEQPKVAPARLEQSVANAAATTNPITIAPRFVSDPVPVAPPAKDKTPIGPTTTVTTRGPVFSFHTAFKNKTFTDVTIMTIGPTTTTYSDRSPALTTTHGGAATTIHCGTLRQEPNGSWVLVDVTITHPDGRQTHVKSMAMSDSDIKRLFTGGTSKVGGGAASGAPAPR